MFFELQKSKKAEEKAATNKEKNSNPVEDLLESLCSNHQISLEELTEHLNDSTKFHPQEWAQMLEFREKLENNLSCVLENISNPQKTDEKYKELEQARRWIFVR